MSAYWPIDPVKFEYPIASVVFKNLVVVDNDISHSFEPAKLVPMLKLLAGINVFPVLGIRVVTEMFIVPGVSISSFPVLFISSYNLHLF